LIVEAFAVMPEKRLVVIGDGPDLKKIQSRVKSNITLLGYANALRFAPEKFRERFKAYVSGVYLPL
jgi:glycosyltransferase involved in cell wall biosynthesis